MLSALLCLCLSQAPPDRPVPEILFRKIVEDWCVGAAITTAPQKRIDRILSEPDARLLHCLGSPDYDARYIAEDVIRNRGPSALRLLCVGVRATDPEIRNRAERLLDGLMTCPDCSGSGGCRECGHYVFCNSCWADDWRLRGLCKTCRGSGNLLREVEREREQW